MRLGRHGRLVHRGVALDRAAGPVVGAARRRGAPSPSPDATHRPVGHLSTMVVDTFLRATHRPVGHLSTMVVDTFLRATHGPVGHLSAVVVGSFLGLP